MGPLVDSKQERRERWGQESQGPGGFWEEAASPQHLELERQLGSEAGTPSNLLQRPSPCTALPTALYSPGLSPQDPHVDQYEAKEWTFIIENVSAKVGWALGLRNFRAVLRPLTVSLPCPQESKGQRKVLATAEVDLARHAGPVPVQVPLRLRLKPKSVKVVQAELSLTLSGVLLREGRAT